MWRSVFEARYMDGSRLAGAIASTSRSGVKTRSSDVTLYSIGEEQPGDMLNSSCMIFLVIVKFEHDAAYQQSVQREQTRAETDAKGARCSTAPSYSDQYSRKTITLN